MPLHRDRIIPCYFTYAELLFILSRIFVPVDADQRVLAERVVAKVDDNNHHEAVL